MIEIVTILRDEVANIRNKCVILKLSLYVVAIVRHTVIAAIMRK